MNRIFGGLLWLMIAMASGVIRSAYAIDIAQYQQDLATLVPDGYYTNLKVDDSSTPVISHDANTPATKGVAILLSDMDKRPDYRLIKLAQALNDMGWFTLLSVTPDFSPVDKIPSEQNIDKAKRDDIYHKINKDHFVDLGLFAQNQKRFADYIKALTEQARQQPGFTLIIASGTAAAGLANLYANNSVKPADGLVTLQPYWPDAPLNQQLPGDLAKANVAVLDIVNQADNRWSLATVKARRIAAGKAFKVHYRQRHLIGSGLSNSAQIPYLAKEISGWTTSMGW